MTKPVIIAEKPAMAADIARALGGFNKDSHGYWESEKFLLASAVGHMATLKEPQDYNPAWKRWSLKSLPIIPEHFGLKVLPRQAKQFSLLAKLLKQTNMAINACDAGREGELIFRYICQLVGFRGKVQRLWISSLTVSAIRRGFQDLRDGQAYENLAHAARCRSQGDWLVGINATRAFTVKHGQLLSVGRVQTPTLAMLVERERNIREFEPRPYWVITAQFSAPGGQYAGRWFKGKEDRVWQQDLAQQIQTKVAGQQGQIVQHQEKSRKEAPRLLWDLTSLQREANRRWGFSAARTLTAAQKLYERHKVITYPRTNSRFLTPDIIPSFPRRLRALDKAGYGEYTEALLPKPPRLTGRFINPARVRDHHAIIPTEKSAGNLRGDEAKIYDLVARRFIAAFYPYCEWKETRVVTRVEDEDFESKGKQLVNPGWRQMEGLSKEDILPCLSQGEIVQVQEVQVKQDQTKPPARYTEGTLLAAMEGAGKLVEEDELREAMKESGLGTPATRAAIIQRLKQVEYIGQEGKSLFPTSKGEQLIDLISLPALISPELTGQWEKRLSDMEMGQEDPAIFMRDVVQMTQELVTQVAASKRQEIAKPVREPLGKCPLCGGDVMENKRAYGCQNWKPEDGGCKFVIWKTIAKKRITPNQAKQLLTKGKTGKLRGFTSKKGKKFSATLVLEDGKVQFHF